MEQGFISRLLRILRQSRSCNHDREVKKIGLRMTGSMNAGSSGLLVVYIIDDRGFGYQVSMDVTAFSTRVNRGPEVGSLFRVMIGDNDKTLSAYTHDHERLSQRVEPKLPNA